MALPDYTTQDATTYKTNIDATAQDHETKLGDRVPNNGATLDPTDGSVLVGTSVAGAISALSIGAGGVNFPDEYMEIRTFDTATDDNYGIFSLAIGASDRGGKMYIQRYDKTTRVGNGWVELSMQKTTGGGSNVAGGGTVGTDADTARALYTWCDVNTPQTDVFYLINAIVNGDTGNLENQFAMGGSGGIYKRDSTDDGATWSEWVKLANVTAGGSMGDWETVDVSALNPDWEQWDSNEVLIRTDGKTIEIGGAIIYRGAGGGSGVTAYTLTFPDLGVVLGTKGQPAFLPIGNVGDLTMSGLAQLVFLSSTSVELKVAETNLDAGGSVVKLAFSFPIQP